MFNPKAVPSRFRHVIWEYETVETVEGAFVLMKPTDEPVYDEDETKLLMTILSLSPTGDPSDVKPILFHTQIEAELYRNFILGQNDEHEVKDYLLAELPENVKIEGYYKRQSVAVCPHCQTIAQYADPTTEEYYCEKCNKSFLPEQH